MPSLPFLPPLHHQRKKVNALSATPTGVSPPARVAADTPQVPRCNPRSTLATGYTQQPKSSCHAAKRTRIKQPSSQSRACRKARAIGCMAGIGAKTQSTSMQAKDSCQLACPRTHHPPPPPCSPPTSRSVAPLFTALSPLVWEVNFQRYRRQGAWVGIAKMD
jgi:hypothetical protein